MIRTTQRMASVNVNRRTVTQRPVNIVLMTGKVVHWVETMFDYTSADAITHVNRIGVPSGRGYELLLLRVGMRRRK